MKIQILHTTDSNGKHIAKVPLANSDKYATLYEEDFNYLVNLGLNLRWTAGQDGVVHVGVPGRTNLGVARLVTDAHKERVVHINGDKTDLRRDNLALDSNGLRAKIRARDLVIPMPRLNNKIEIEHVYKHGKTNANAGSVTN